MKRLIACWITLLLCLSMAGCEGAGAPTAQPSPTPVDGTIEVHFMDVGQGDAALLLCGEQSMLIDGGNVGDSSLVVSYLAEQGVQELDYVVCTHAHEDHVGGLSGPMARYPAGQVFSPVTEYASKAFGDFARYTEEQGLELTLPTPGETWNLGEAVVTVLGPQQAYEDTNNTSIVLRVDFGAVSFLFTGDAERTAEADMLEAGAELQADVLKVGHHGSNTSSSYPFLREVMPEYAVISCETGNSYGHPHEEPLSRLRDAGAAVYRTDMQGHIVAVSDGETVSFTTQKNQDADTNPGAADAGGPYIGNKNSQIFHHADCSGLPAEQNQVLFETRPDAVSAGYSACGRCKP